MSDQTLFTECCNVPIAGDWRWCPKCGQECRVHIAPVQLPTLREAFRAGFLATVPNDSKTRGWSFDGPAAADRESDAWDAWQALLIVTAVQATDHSHNWRRQWEIIDGRRVYFRVCVCGARELQVQNADIL